MPVRREQAGDDRAGDRPDHLRRHRRQADREDFPPRSEQRCRAIVESAGSSWSRSPRSRTARPSSSRRDSTIATAAPVNSRRGTPNQPKIRIGSSARFSAAPPVMTKPGMPRVARGAHRAAGHHRDREQHGAGVVDEQVAVDVVEHVAAARRARGTAVRSSRCRLR